MRTILTTLLLAFLITTTTAAQPGPPDQARPIEGVILIKFAPNALKTPPQQLRPNELGVQGKQAARLRQLLNAQRGPGQKLFRNFTPVDTLGFMDAGVGASFARTGPATRHPHHAGAATSGG